MVGIQVEPIDRNLPEIVGAHRREHAPQRTLIGIEEVRIDQQIMTGRIDDLEPGARPLALLKGTGQVTACRPVRSADFATYGEGPAGNRREHDPNNDPPSHRGMTKNASKQSLSCCVHAGLFGWPWVHPSSAPGVGPFAPIAAGGLPPGRQPTRNQAANLQGRTQTALPDDTLAHGGPTLCAQSILGGTAILDNDRSAESLTISETPQLHAL